MRLVQTTFIGAFKKDLTRLVCLFSRQLDCLMWEFFPSERLQKAQGSL